MADAYGAGAGGSPPKMPRGDGNRARNTVQNALSKSSSGYTNPGGASALPALSPEMTANYYQQLAGLASQYQTELASLKAQRIGLRAGFVQTKAGIRQDLISGLAGAQQDATERGVLGSSAALQNEIGVRAGASAAKAAAKNELLQGLAQNRLAAQGAGNQYFLSATALEGNKLAAQQSALSDQLRNNLVVSGQESQMDVLKAIYQALANATNRGGGAGGGRVPYPSELAGTTIYNGDNQLMQILTGLGRAAGVGLYG